MVTFTDIKFSLSEREPKKLADDGSKRGAVVIPIFERENKLYMLFTKRTEELRTHKGQISFPGGKIDEDDSSLLQCALREAHEEIGILPEKFSLLGELNQTKTNSSNILLSSFVAKLEYPFEIIRNEQEVDEIIEVPFDALCETDKWERKVVRVDGEEVGTWFFHYNNRIIWGATAQLVKQLLEHLKHLFDKKS